METIPTERPCTCPRKNSFWLRREHMTNSQHQRLHTLRYSVHCRSHSVTYGTQSPFAVPTTAPAHRVCIAGYAVTQTARNQSTPCSAFWQVHWGMGRLWGTMGAMGGEAKRWDLRSTVAWKPHELRVRTGVRGRKAKWQCALYSVPLVQCFVRSKRCGDVDSGVCYGGPTRHVVCSGASQRSKMRYVWGTDEVWG